MSEVKHGKTPPFTTRNTYRASQSPTSHIVAALRLSHIRSPHITHALGVLVLMAKTHSTLHIRLPTRYGYLRPGRMRHRASSSANINNMPQKQPPPPPPRSPHDPVISCSPHFTWAQRLQSVYNGIDGETRRDRELSLGGAIVNEICARSTSEPDAPDKVSHFYKLHSMRLFS